MYLSVPFRALVKYFLYNFKKYCNFLYNFKKYCKLTFSKNQFIVHYILIFFSVKVFLHNVQSDSKIFLIKIYSTKILQFRIRENISLYNWANYLQSVFWTQNFEKKFWISIKILSPTILDFYGNFLSKYWISTKNFVEVQYFDKKIHRSPVFWDLEF